MNVEDLNKCLRDELSATQTYRQALEKNRELHGQNAESQQLSQILEDHERAASRLRALIQQLGGTPSEDAGAWGTWSQTVMGTAKLLGDKAALKALKEGEESGAKDYQSVAEDPSASTDAKNVVEAHLAKQHEHIRTLDRLMETA